jgi:hypothetical protein
MQIQHSKTYLLTIAFVALFLMPYVLFAQTSSGDLRSAIQSSVLADPRVANIPPAQLQGLVDALVAQARAQNMTVADILWRPQQAAASTFGAPGAQSVACTSGWQGYACQFNRVFGFEGNSYEIPIFLLVTTAFLIAVIWELILHHRKKMAMKVSTKPSSPPLVR